jgi:hypothetical protein
MAGEPYRVTCNGVNMIHLGLALATFDVYTLKVENGS